MDIIKKLPIEITCIHVKSHQDDDTEIQLLPWEAQMNVQADKLATDYHLDNYAEPSKIIPFIPPSQASLTIKGETITRRYANRFRLEASSPDLRKRMILRYKWNNQIFQSINWEVPDKALSTLEHSPQIFITKFAHEHLPTRKHMKRLGEAETDKCPACLQTTETAWHILSCEKRSAWRNRLIKDLKELLNHINTQPDVSLILIQGIRGALNDPEYQMNTEHRETRFQYLVEAQNRIGWQHMLKGRCSHHWIQIQQHHIQLDPDIDESKQSGD
jgi:hypothetical protein